MRDQMLPSLITLSLLLAMFLWALLIDLLIHLKRRHSGQTDLSGDERRKNRLPAGFPQATTGQSRLTHKPTLRDS